MKVFEVVLVVDGKVKEIHTEALSREDIEALVVKSKKDASIVSCREVGETLESALF